MNLAQAISAYLNLNVLVGFGFVGLAIAATALKILKVELSARVTLGLHYTVLLTIFSLTVIQPFLPQKEFFSPPAKVWSAQSITNFSAEFSGADDGGYLSLPTPMGPSTIRSHRVVEIWGVLAFVVFALGGAWLGRDLAALLSIRKTSFLIRRIGKVRIYLHDGIRVPFSYWWPGQANVVIPASFIERRKDFKMAVLHELQHHRQGDTRWVYAVWGLRWICVANPFVPVWSRWISEIQEFACDETLVDQNKVESQAYARCLIEAAQSAIGPEFVPVCATGLTFLTGRNILKRRITQMLSKSKSRNGRSIGIAIGTVMALAMSAGALASNGLVQDRRVSLAQATAMAARVRSKTEFPIVINKSVLKELNRYIGTPEGREYMRQSLARLTAYKTTIETRLKKYHAPKEIIALPLIESGYQNLAESRTAMRSAGLWQFIPATARNFGLRVDKQGDDRLDVGRSSDAAIRLLQADHLRFSDWQLAILAYNAGENAVQKGIAATGSRDAWTLIHHGYEGDKGYLARFMAALLIMKSPESVE